MRKGLIVSVILVSFIVFSTAGHAYNYSSGALYCTDCADCINATTNSTYNTVYLNQTIANHTGTCINQSAALTNKIFDCQGYTIDGDDTGYGIDLYVKKHNTIRNCIITDFNYGIYMHTFADNNTIINNTINSNTRGVFTIASPNNTITNNTFNSNTDYGVYVQSDNTTLINNTANLNGDSGSDSGIMVVSSSYNRIIDNTANNNYNGILSSGSRCTITNNIANSNDIYGIYLDGGSYNNVTGNTVNLNSDSGLVLSNSKYNNIINNTISSNPRYGIHTSAENNTISDNTIASNRFAISIFNADGSNLTNNVMTLNTYGIIINIGGNYVKGYNNNFSVDNTVNGKQVYYYHDKQDVILSPSNPGFVGCYNCTNITFSGFSISGSGNGIVLARTNNSNITNVTVGSNYIGFYFNKEANDNTVSDSFIYDNEYRNVVDYGTNNIFLDDNVYMYDMVTPLANTWYTSFDEMSFKISNLTYANMSCMQYISDTLVNTNNSVQANQKTPFTYILPEGPNTYYFYCADVDSGDVFDFTTENIAFGIKMSDGSPCTGDNQCLGGYCVNGLCSATSGDSSDGSFIPSTGGLPPEAAPSTLPLTIGNVFVPSGGLVMVLDNETTLDLYGTKANIKDIYVIDPDTLSPLNCNQTSLSSYEINVDIDDKAYVCFDKTDYSDLQSITVYTIKENNWQQLDEIIEKDGKICGRITSSPYMIAGFSIPATGVSALDMIQLASASATTPEEKSLVNQASEAYLNCDYDKAYDLAQSSVSLTPIEVSDQTVTIMIVLAAVLLGGFYIYKHPKQFKFKKHRKAKR